MADCEFTETCPFFSGSLKQMPPLAERMRTQYCHGNKKQCARYVVRMALGPGTVPPSLFPHQMDQARELIAAAAA